MNQLSTKEQIDKFLTEHPEIGNGCWHEYEYTNGPCEPHTFKPVRKARCAKCNSSRRRRTFHSWEGFGELWEKVKDRKDFLEHACAPAWPNNFRIWTEHIDQKNFPGLVAEWLGWEGGGVDLTQA